MKALIIILGAARSGSTLVAKTIGNHPMAFTLGEINRFNQEIENKETLCGCGKLLYHCEFWNDILASRNLKYGLENKEKNQ